MRRHHAISLGFFGHYEDLGSSSSKGVILCRGSEISVDNTQEKGDAECCAGAEHDFRTRYREYGLPPPQHALSGVRWGRSYGLVTLLLVITAGSSFVVHH